MTPMYYRSTRLSGAEPLSACRLWPVGDPVGDLGRGAARDPAGAARARWRRSPTAALARSGATETSARSRSIARTTPAPTSAGRRGARERRGRGVRRRRTCRHRGSSPASPPRRRCRSRAGPRAARARSREGRTWSRSRARPARSRPCRRARRRRPCGPSRAPLTRATSSRAMRIGASRLTRSARPISLLRVVVEPARGRQRRVGDQDVDVAGRREQRSASALLGEVGDLDPMAAARQRGGEAPRARRPLRELSTSVRAALGERLGDRPPEAAGGPGEQHGLAAELHARQPNRIGCPADEALRLLGNVPDAAAGRSPLRTTPTTRSGTPATTPR